MEVQRRVVHLDLDGTVFEIRQCAEIDKLERADRVFKFCPVCGGRRQYKSGDGRSTLEHEKLYSDVVQ